MAIDKVLVGRRVKGFRELAGLTRNQLARLMGVKCCHSLLLIENGRRMPSLGHLERLAEYCNSSMHEILERVVEPQESFLLRDEFIAEIAPLVKNISPRNRKILFEVLQDLQKKSTRSARAILARSSAHTPSGSR